ncbi:MAG TPA: type I glutamate--ammonia ligase [Chloroflexota bacterium]|nr:type I glutamate--ammonia ligase [Chloroflexota bacterium]
MSPSDVLRLAEEQGAKMVDFKFVDMPGTWQHFSIPLSQLDQDLFHAGIGFDGSSIRGFQEIHESDMLLLPDPTTAVIDPFGVTPTLSLICDVVEPGTLRPYSRDPRSLAKRAEAYLRDTGIADTSYFGPEAEFFIFDDVRYDSAPHTQFYAVDSSEGNWNTARDERPNLANKIRNKEGYFPVPPVDSLQDLRNEMCLVMESVGVPVERQHHEVATAGQAEIDMKFDTLVGMADKLMMYKYVVKNVAWRHGKVVTFMPKPIYGDNGSGMHVHQSLWKKGAPLFFDARGYAQLSEMARFYIGGLLLHAPAILAFAAPTTNSYRRLVPGFEAPVNLVFSARNRSAAIRIPMYSDKPHTKRVEFRPPDPSCNPYLAFSAMLLAGLDGIARRIDPSAHGMGPLDKNIYDLSEAEYAEIRSVPGSLVEALGALDQDRAFLTAGGVFSDDLIDDYLSYKMAREVDEVRLRPTPHEFYLYFDV